MTVWHALVIVASLALAGFCIHDPSCAVMAKDVMYLCLSTIVGAMGHAGSRAHFQGTATKKTGDASEVSSVRSVESDR